MTENKGFCLRTYVAAEREKLSENSKTLTMEKIVEPQAKVQDFTKTEEQKFDLSKHIESIITANKKDRSELSPAETQQCMEKFNELCKKIREEVNKQDEKEVGNEANVSTRHKKAIIGYEKDVEYYKNLVSDVLRRLNLTQEPFPAWYDNLVDAIFCECWGLPGGLNNWLKGATQEFKESSSAKIIGDKVYYLINGKSTLQPQTINTESRERLRKALLLLTPEKNPYDKYHEVYLLDKTRVTIFNANSTGNSGFAKQGQDSIVFRKFIIKELTFEQQAKFHTIPYDIIPMLKAMIRIGFNVAFVGAVRTAKTTFLSTWQKLENPNLEGVLIETDPEIPLHELMPGAPIIQLLINDGDKGEIIKSVMRSDADYIVIGEARDGNVLNIAIKAANKGTRRVKITYHTTDPFDFFRDVADDIFQEIGGDRDATAIRVAKSFHYIFQFVQLPNKSQKRLKGIWEMRYLRDEQVVEMHQICKYIYETDGWVFNYTVPGSDKKMIGEEEDQEAFKLFQESLTHLAEKFPDPDPEVYRQPIQTNRKAG